MAKTSLVWVVAALAAFGAGGFVFHFPGSYGEPSVSLPAALFGLILGGLNGAAVGLLLGLAIKAPRAVIGRLAGVMAAAIGVTHALFDGSSTALPLVVWAIVAGVSVAAIFARWLDADRTRAVILGAAWSAGIVLAAAAGDALGLPRAATPIEWALDHTVDGIGTALVWGITGAALGLPARVRGVQPA